MFRVHELIDLVEVEGVVLGTEKKRSWKDEMGQVFGNLNARLKV